MLHNSLKYYCDVWRFFMLKNYVFDLYGTLVDIRTNEWKPYLWKKMAEFYGLYGAKYTPKEMEKAYHKYADEELEATYKKMKGKNGISCVDDAEIQLEKVFQRLFTEKGVDADIALGTHAGQMFRVISMKFEKVYDGVFELLDTLKKKGKKIYLLSNAQYIFTGYEINALDLTPYFDGIVISSNECCKKPSKEFYNVLLERYNLKKEETVMVGNDQYADIQGAKNAGLTAYYVHTEISPEYIESECPADFKMLDGNIKDMIKLI